jgi:hypothetical protein
MEKIQSFFKTLENDHLDLFTTITTQNRPDGQKLRVFLNEKGIDCKGSTMFAMVQALSFYLENLEKSENLENSKNLKNENETVHETVHTSHTTVSTNNESKQYSFSKEFKEELKQCESIQPTHIKKKYTVKDCDIDAVQALSFEFEVLQGVYKAGKPDESRQKALEDAHIKCDQALDWIIDIKNSTDDFSSVINVVTYASDTPSLANALFEVYLSLN